MNEFRTLAQSVCLTLLFTGIFSALMPSKSMEKVFRFMLGLFFLSSLVLPFIGKQPDISFDFFAANQTPVRQQTLEEGLEINLVGLLQQNVGRKLCTLLRQNGIPAEKVVPEIHIDEDNSIDISKISVYLPAEYQDFRQAAAECMEKEAGIKTEVVIGK